MELSTSFQSKMSNSQRLYHFFFSKEPGNRFVVVCACEKGEESGGKDKTAVGQLEMPRILIWPLLL